jgi:hypothetical protein
MIDVIPRSREVFDQRRAKLEMKFKKLDSLTSSHSDRNANLANHHRKIEETNMVEQFVKNDLFFAPLPFNSHVSPVLGEEETPVSQMAVGRLLFCYFGSRISFGTFRTTFLEMIQGISVETVLEAIRWDYSLSSTATEEDAEKKNRTLRALVLVDEISKVSNIKDRVDVRKQELYECLRDSLFKGLY